MRRLDFLILFIALSIDASAQNLITNGDLENGSGLNFFTMQNWNRFSGTPDAYTPVNDWGSGSATGGTLPHSGNGYVGFYQYGYWGGLQDQYEREYIVGGIDTPLEAEHFYLLEYYVRPINADLFQISYAVDQIGALLTNAVPTPDSQNIFSEEPQITNGGTVLNDLNQWTKISGCYTAQGGEQYVTIGNFQTDEQTNAVALPSAVQPDLAYYLLDNVSLVEVTFPDLLSDTTLCGGDSFEVTLNHPTATYLWDNGDTSAQHLIDHGGTHFVDITVGDCSKRREILVESTPTPLANPTEEISICEGQSFRIDPPDEGLDLIWNDGSTHDFLQVDEPGLYWLEKSNDCGSATDYFEITAEDCACHVFVPNSFTPDSDGINDNFSPVIDCELQNYKLEIFDRWGTLLFETTDKNLTWNGGSSEQYYAEDGMYNWILSFESVYGSSIHQRQTGSVLLIR